MAEEVQRILDGMVPALHDLQERHVFTKAEIHAIVNQRRTYEYALRRRQPRPTDYLAYIQYEMQLEQLRKLRVHEQMRRNPEQFKRQILDAAKDEDEAENNNNNNNKQQQHASSKHIGDRHIVQHLHLLWTRTLRKYKAQVNLYLEYAAFCKSVHAYKTLSRVYGEAVRLHPHAIPLWMEAASHEFFHAGNMTNARVLLQRALRVNKLSSSSSSLSANHASSGAQELWWQLFTLELHFATKMAGRQQILLSSSNDGKDGKETKEADPIASNAVTNGNDKVDDESSYDHFKIARLVFDQAMQAMAATAAAESQNSNTNHKHNHNHSSLVRFGVKFGDLTRQFPATAALRQYILNAMMETCGDHQPDAWLAWAVWAWEQQEEVGTEKEESQSENNKDNNLGGSSSSSRKRAPESETTQSNGHDDDDDDKEADEDQPTNGPSQKKQKNNDGQATPVVQGGTSLISILRQALQAIETEEMYVKAARMVHRYLDSVPKSARRHKNKTTDTRWSDGVTFLQDLFTKAVHSTFYSANLAMEYAMFLMRNGENAKAVACLENFIQDNNSVGGVPARVWIQYADLVMNNNNNGGHQAAAAILERASRQIGPDHKDHLGILLRLFGCKLMMMALATSEHDNNIEAKASLFSLLERIILLAPGFKGSLVFEDEVESFGVTGLADALLKYLFYTRANDIKTCQKIYQSVLYKSTIAKALLEEDQDRTIQFFSAAIEVEKEASTNKERKRRKTDLKRLYDTLIGFLGESALADDFRQQKMEDLMKASSSRPVSVNIPKLNAKAHKFNPTSLATAFEKYRVVHLTNVVDFVTKGENTLNWQHLGELFASLDSKDKESWCLETNEGDNNKTVTPETFLVSKNATGHRAYSSFLVQKDIDAYQQTESKLPLTELPDVQGWSYERALWIFFGRNPPGKQDLPGRPDHTDSISADGTWHYQLSGIKKWIIRPTPELLQHMSSTLSPSEFENWRSSSNRIEILCRQGDVLVINTRLWFHQTYIPGQPTPSVSYARDFWRNSPSSQEDDTDGAAMMTNVDGLYATTDIEEGTIIFTSEKMPDCELHESQNPNCEVVELDDARQAIVSCRRIQAGEFFCVAQSDDEEESGEEDDGEEKVVERKCCIPVD